jgi:RNA polymerase sigma-70 factor (ECF subfamily)
MPGPNDTFQRQLVELLPRLRRFARGLACSDEDGDDLLQAACARALTNHHQWRPGSRLDSWMYRIVQTVWIDQLRHRRSQVSALAEVEAMAQDREDGLRTIELRQTWTAVRRAMVQLPPSQRSVLLLVCVEGLSYREAAELLETPIGTVMSRLARARASLGAMLEGMERVREPLTTAEGGWG